LNCQISGSAELTRGNRSLRALGFRAKRYRATAILLAQAAQVALEILTPFAAVSNWRGRVTPISPAIWQFN
jgi:hypothetical protein